MSIVRSFIADRRARVPARAHVRSDGFSRLVSLTAEAVTTNAGPALRLRLRRLALAALISIGLLSPAAPVWAAAPTITGVEPGSVSNALSSVFAVSGTGFDNSAVVVLEGFGALSTTRVSAYLLTATLPAGVPAGVYTVKVINGSDATSSSLPNALTVTGPTATPAPSSTPAPTAYVRPVVIVQSYGASSPAISPNTDLDFEITLVNTGQGVATNIVATFAAGDFIPRLTGGVRSVGALGPGQSARFFQPLTATGGIAGKSVATLDVKVTYTDTGASSFTESFALTFPVARAQGPARTATPTPKPNQRPQLLVTGYRTDAEVLQPGTQFSLSLDVQNAGSMDAKRVTMILGGGSSSGGGTGGTPGAGTGGVSGAGGEFTNFAPLKASNVQYLGDLSAGGSLGATVDLIVNSSTKPGAYPVKLSLVYTDDRGVNFTDDQVITLLVYQPPVVDVSFYRPVDALFAGQPGLLPIQVVNLGRSSAVLGNMKVAGEGAQFSNNIILVGALDTGGYFPLDATVIPGAAGPLDITVSIEYTDDFNQSQTLTRTLTVDVMEAPVMPPGEGGMPEPPMPEPETFLQKVWRFLRGLFGLDSGPSTPAGPSEMPPGELPPPEVRPAGPKG